MLQLRNTSPFVAEMLGFPDSDGVDTLFVVVKGTFRCNGAVVSIADEQQPVTLADEYWGTRVRRACGTPPRRICANREPMW